jgi:hypothetical protein
VASGWDVSRSFAVLVLVGQSPEEVDTDRLRRNSVRVVEWLAGSGLAADSRCPGSEWS